MTKKIRIQLPKDEMTIREIEVWLNEKAKEGFHLVRFRINKIIFIEDEPKDIKYRIIPLKGTTSTILEKYSRQGYERVAKGKRKYKEDLAINFVKFYIFKSTKDDSNHNIEGDKIDNEYIKCLYKDISPLYSRFLYLLFYSFWFSSMFSECINNLLLHKFFALILFALFCAYMIIRSFIKYYKKLKSFDNLDEDIIYIIKQKNRVRRLKSTFNFETILIVVCLILFFVYVRAESIDHGRYKEKDLRNANSIEEITIIDIDKEVNAEEINHDYYYLGISKQNFIISNHYYLNKELVLNEEKISDYRIKYYNFRINNIVPWVIEKWVDKNSVTVLEHSKPVYVSSNNFDTIVYLLDTDENVNEISLCFYNGKEFIDLWYKGSKTPQEIIDTVDKICSEQ